MYAGSRKLNQEYQITSKEPYTWWTNLIKNIQTDYKLYIHIYCKMYYICIYAHAHISMHTCVCMCVYLFYFWLFLALSKFSWYFLIYPCLSNSFFLLLIWIWVLIFVFRILSTPIWLVVKNLLWSNKLLPIVFLKNCMTICSINVLIITFETLFSLVSSNSEFLGFLFYAVCTFPVSDLSLLCDKGRSVKKRMQYTVFKR